VNNTLDRYDSYLRSGDWLADRDKPVAVTLTELLEPSGGAGTVIFPATYAKGDKSPSPYDIDVLRSDIPPEEAGERAEVNICHLDSVGSQANRMEPVFAQTKLVPQVFIVGPDGSKVNLLEVGHRITDGAVGFSALEAEAVQCIEALREGNAVNLAKLAPTSLLFGLWDSRRTQFRFPRILSSYINATNVAPLRRSAQFNPAFEPSALGYESGDQIEKNQDDKNPLSQVGLRAVPSVDQHGGVRVYGHIVRKTEINLVTLRSLTGSDESETLKLRRYILGLALVAGRAQSNYNLRQGCLLIAKSKPTAQLVYPDKRDTFAWEFPEALEYSTLAAEEFGVGAGGEYAFEKTKLDTFLKKAEAANTAAKEKKAARRKERGA